VAHEVAKEGLDRQALVQALRRSSEQTNEWMRRQILVNDRVDILAKEVLGYEVQPFHLALMRWQLVHKHSLQLAFRGCGKTTVCTVVQTIHAVLKNRNIRVLVASKTATHAQSILREIKGQLEENEKLKEIFGELQSEDKWDSAEIEVKGRTVPAKEATVTCIGVGGQAVGKHYDIILGDDLVDEENSRTEYMRRRLYVWYYKTLHPCLEPTGELHLLGTRYHFDDLYGHLSSNEMKSAFQVIRALDDKGRSPWPTRYSSVFFKEKRRQLGVIIFNSQYQCDTEAMKGEIFQYDWMDTVQAEQVPANARFYFGIDLAIKEKEQGKDKFAMVAIAVTKDQQIYVVAHYSGHLSFSKQTAKVLEWWRGCIDGWCSKDQLIQAAIETNAYQESQYQKLLEEEPGLCLRPIVTTKDKITRAHKLAARFEEGKVHFVEGQHELVEHLVLFPGGRYKDLFDALDLAVNCAFNKRRRKVRKTEPGIM